MAMPRSASSYMITRLSIMRREFDNATRIAALKRAEYRCEAIRYGQRCNILLRPGRMIFDHRIPDRMGGEPTLDNCQVICDLCDKEKTAEDQARIARTRRMEAQHLLGKSKAKSQSQRRRGFKGWRKFNGEIVWNDKN